MNDELEQLRSSGYKPLLVGPKNFSLDEILRNVDPAPDEQIERFVAAIYEDRQQSAGNASLNEPDRR